MNLTELKLLRYGPLSEVTLDPQQFNLVYGSNETGKTLLLEALLKFLYPDKKKIFSWFERVEEQPEGWALIEQDGKEFKLPEHGSLDEIAQLSPTDFRNLFVVRDSDLSVEQQGAEQEYYTRLTEKLTGLRARDMQAIREELADIGRLTRSDTNASLANTQGSDNKLKDRYQMANELLDKIDSVEDDIRANKFDELYSRLQEKRSQFEEYKIQIKQQNSAEEFKNHSEAYLALENYKKAEKAIDSHAGLDESILEKWKELNREIQSIENNKERATELIEKNEKKLPQLEAAASQAKNRAQRFRERQKIVYKQVETKLEELDKVKEEFVGMKSTEPYWRYFSFSMTTLTGLTIFAVVFTGQLLWTALILLFGVAGLFGGWQLYKIYNKKGKRDVIFQSLLAELNKLELKANSYDEIHPQLTSFEEKVEEAETVAKTREKELGRAREQISQARTEIEENQEKLIQLNDELDDLKRNSQSDEISQLQQKLEEKKNAEIKSDKEIDRLKQLVSRLEPDPPAEKNLQAWENWLERIKPDGDAPEQEFDPALRTRLEAEFENNREEISRIENDIRNLRHRLKDISERAAAQLDPDGFETIKCEDPNQLSELKGQLDEFVQKIELEKDAALEAINIFEELENEETEEVESLFDSESSAVKYFREISGRPQADLQFDRGAGCFYITTGEGTTLRPEQLSGGTFDQLYFSIRLSLAELLLDEKPGFFLLDDAFIKSDIDRLARQFDLVEKLIEKGWQIIYFSAKQEILQIVKKRFPSCPITELND